MNPQRLEVPYAEASPANAQSTGGSPAVAASDPVGFNCSRVTRRKVPLRPGGSRATSATHLCAHGWLGLIALLLGLLLNGCVTPTAIDWDTRVGKQTFDATVQELGQPGKMTSLADGSRVAEWLAIRGTSTPNYHSFPDGRVLRTESARGPDRWLVLTFSPDGQLKAWQRVWR